MQNAMVQCSATTPYRSSNSPLSTCSIEQLTHVTVQWKISTLERKQGRSVLEEALLKLCITQQTDFQQLCYNQAIEAEQAAKELADLRVRHAGNRVSLQHQMAQMEAQMQAHQKQIQLHLQRQLHFAASNNQVTRTVR